MSGKEESYPEVTEIETLCVNCLKNGVTKFLFTRIPFFKGEYLSEVVLDNRNGSSSCFAANYEVHYGK